MIWNKKRINDMQVYKEKGDGFLVVFFDNRYPFLHTAFCGIWKEALPDYRSFCHSNCTYDFLSKSCYPVSQKQLQKYPEWYKFFNSYIGSIEK